MAIRHHHPSLILPPSRTTMTTTTTTTTTTTKLRLWLWLLLLLPTIIVYTLAVVVVTPNVPFLVMVDAMTIPSTTTTSSSSSLLPPLLPRPVTKVAIIGGGISGLSFAHALRSQALMQEVIAGKIMEQQQQPSRSWAMDTKRNQQLLLLSTTTSSNDGTTINAPEYAPSTLTTTLTTTPMKITMSESRRQLVVPPPISVIDIFESRSTFGNYDGTNSTNTHNKNTGSGIQLTGGMVALHRIHPTLQKMVSEAALPLEKIVSYCRPWWWWSSSSSAMTTTTTLSSSSTTTTSLLRDTQQEERKKKKNNGWKILELNIKRAILERQSSDELQRQEVRRRRLKMEKEEEGDIMMGYKDSSRADTNKKKYSLVSTNGEILAYTILRSTLQQILKNTLWKEYDIPVQFDKRLVDISYSSSSSLKKEDNEKEEEEDMMHDESGGIYCHFADGTTSGPYDIVVGCDGIGSVVKEYVNTGKIRNNNSTSTLMRRNSAIYSGLRITFAIQEEGEGGDNTKKTEAQENIGRNKGDTSSERDGDDGNNTIPSSCQFNQFFGNGAYALTSSYGAGMGMPPTRGAFLVYPDPNYFGPFPKKKMDRTATTIRYSDRDTSNKSDQEAKNVNMHTSTTTTSTNTNLPLLPDENPDWSQDNRITNERINECLHILQCSSVPGLDSISSIINEKSTRFFDLGVYLHNPFSWNGWIREVVQSGRDGSGDSRTSSGSNTSTRTRRGTGSFVITAGDASHAMPPFLGQGANQALQDSCTLAAKIFEYNYEVVECTITSSLSQAVVVDTAQEIIPTYPDLKTYLEEYERLRWWPTTSLTFKAAILGYLEVGPGFLGNIRDVVFFFMGKAGLAKKIFLDAATPKM